MTKVQPSSGQELIAEKTGPAKQIDAVGWAALLIWAGIAMLTQVPWGWFLVGVGAGVLASQLARWLKGINVAGFWLACGVVLIAGGIWTLLGFSVQLAPVLLILLGLAMLGDVVRARPR